MKTIPFNTVVLASKPIKRGHTTVATIGQPFRVTNSETDQDHFRIIKVVRVGRNAIDAIPFTESEFEKHFATKTKPMPEENPNPNNFHELENVSELIGGMICCILDEDDANEEPGAFGFVVIMPSGTQHKVWIQADDEGNKPGHLLLVTSPSVRRRKKYQLA